MSVGRVFRRSTAVALALGLALAAVGSAAAMPPTSERGSAGAQRPGGGGGGAGGGGGGSGGGGKATRGYDISYPQCGAPYPANPAFGIVGVNGGRVFSVNPCLASQITWGGGAATELYINTGNPGPELSSFWPVGQTSPRFCDPDDTDSADCAYDYGWNAAKHSWDTARAAYAALGLPASPAATTWWLDVETMNSWRTNVSLNVAALQGEVDFLRSVAGVTKLGFYSTTAQWSEITGATQFFAAHPSWGAGAPNERTAKQHCVSTAGFTGGRLAMVQYIYNEFDADVRC